MHPRLHEVLVPDGDDGDRVRGGRGGGGGGGILPPPRYVLEDARPGEEDDQVITVAYDDGSREDVSYAAARPLAAELERVSVKGILAPRFIAAARRTVGDLLASRPFDRPGSDMAVLERLTAGASAVARDRAAGQDGAEAKRRAGHGRCAGRHASGRRTPAAWTGTRPSSPRNGASPSGPPGTASANSGARAARSGTAS